MADTATIQTGLDEFQRQAVKGGKINYPDGPLAGRSDGALMYAALALAGEVGEFANLVKKYTRDGKDIKQLAFEELGDILWYVAAACEQMDVTLGDVALFNIEKLQQRHGKTIE